MRWFMWSYTYTEETFARQTQTQLLFASGVRLYCRPHPPASSCRAGCGLSQFCIRFTPIRSPNPRRPCGPKHGFLSHFRFSIVHVEIKSYFFVDDYFFNHIISYVLIRTGFENIVLWLKLKIHVFITIYGHWVFFENIIRLMTDLINKHSTTHSFSCFHCSMTVEYSQLSSCNNV